MVDQECQKCGRDYTRPSWSGFRGENSWKAEYKDFDDAENFIDSVTPNKIYCPDCK